MFNILLRGAVLGALFVSLCATAAHAAPGDPEVSDDPVVLYNAFQAAWDDSDWEAVDQNGTALSRIPGLSRQPDAFLHYFYIRLGFARVRLENYEGAFAAYETAEDHTNSPARVNLLRTFLHVEMDSWSLAANHVLALAGEDVSVFSELELRTFNEILNGLDVDEDRALSLRVITTVLADYTPEDPFTTLEYMRLRQARLLARDGDYAGAYELISGFQRSTTRANARTEIVFSSLWARPEYDSVTDVRAGAQNELDHWQAMTRDYPDHIQPAHSQIQALLRLGRVEEAEALARSVQAQLESGHPFEDADDYANWLLNEWAYSLYALGRIDEANDIMQRGTGLAENQAPNVSQTINYAGMLVLQGRYEDALTVLQPMDETLASPFGDMWVWSARACAYHYLANTEQSQHYLDLMAENWTDNPSAYQRATICTNRLDEAADLLVQRLQSPNHAPGALAALQVWRPLYSRNSMEHAVEWSEALDQLIHVPAVRDAAAQVGLIEETDLIDFYYGGF